MSLVSKLYKYNDSFNIKKPKKNKRPKKRVRNKSDFFVVRQIEVQNYLKYKITGLKRDYFKARTWFDFADVKHKVVVSIVGRKGPNQEIKKKMEILGWKILYIKFTDPNNESIKKFIVDLNFIRGKEKFIEKRADELNSNLNKSEQWFIDKISMEWFYKRMGFRFNVPMFGSFIYDLYSAKYRLCIEVDGSIHDLERIKIKDELKNKATRNKGFNIIRVKAYDEESYKESIELINMLLKNRKLKLEKQQVFREEIAKIDFKKKMPF